MSDSDRIKAIRKRLDVVKDVWLDDQLETANQLIEQDIPYLLTRLRDKANLCHLVEKATWLIRDLTCDEPRTLESAALDFAYHAERELQRILGLVPAPAEGSTNDKEDDHE